MSCLILVITGAVYRTKQSFPTTSRLNPSDGSTLEGIWKSTSSPLERGQVCVLQSSESPLVLLAYQYHRADWMQHIWAYAEIYVTLATIFRRFDLELYETTREDVDPAFQFMVPSLRLDSKGMRVLTKV